jgi:D-glycero-alpha-D-manno-heptose-7-phosphate kinase
VSFVGGGSDLPWFYQEEPGACVSAAIDKYVYVTVSDKYDGTIRAAYSTTENVAKVEDLQHELIREVLRWHDGTHGIEVHSIADIPGGTGLGSSSAFTVGLLHAHGPGATPKTYAEHACQIEIYQCGKPIGKQDQYAVAYGGVNLLTLGKQTGVNVEPISCDYEALSDHCLLFDTGVRRLGDAAAEIMGQYHDRDNLRQLASLAMDFATELRFGHFDHCGEILDEAWKIKRQYVGRGISSDANALISAVYAAARLNGAWGGKLCGAGGGGFMLFMAPPQAHEAIRSSLGLRQVPIRLGAEGSKVIYSG